jgi:acetylornithine/succinyldiaminopimelate/putrescine aminotransferase
MGALGFGVALAMAAVLMARGGMLAGGFGPELVLLAGGLGGGVAFTVLALRASRMARGCQRQLDHHTTRGGANT